MTENIFKNFLFSVVIYIIFLPLFAYAQNPMITLVSSKDIIGLSEQFYIDIFLDPAGGQINGIEGSVAYPEDKISFVRAEDGQSLIRDWIEKPKEKSGVVSFSGIIPNGFSGVVLGADDKVKKPGLLMRLVFVGIQFGDATISTKNFTVTDNDGLGTTHALQESSNKIKVENHTNVSSYNIFDKQKPEITAYVTSSPDFFANQRVLIFRAIDRESGIQDVFVKENNREWKVATSPYLLEDQSVNSIIKVRAVDFAGNENIFTIRPSISLWVYLLLAVLLIMLLRILYGNRHSLFRKEH